MKLNWPLMKNNITRSDLDALIKFLMGNPVLTQSENVREFEREWSEWLGVKYSVFVNSGSSANLISIAALKQIAGSGGEVIVPALTWVSDISSVLFCGFTPKFVDVNPKTLSMDDEQVIDKLTPDTRAVFLTHAQGFNGLTDRLLDTLKARNIPLIEDVCESHGAEFRKSKLGSFGWVSNFSFYYAHHMSTIEGGMVCTDSEEVYQICRMLRSHGMVREATNKKLNESYLSATTQEEKIAVVKTAIESMEGGDPDTPGSSTIADIVRYGFELGLEIEALKALLNHGHFDAELAEKGRKLDPENNEGILEQVVLAQCRSVDSLEAVQAAVEAVVALDKNGIKDPETTRELYVNTAFWCNRFVKDQEKAMVFAKKAKLLAGDDERLHEMLDEIINSEE